MATTIKTKNSTTAATAPTGLVQGELAVNITDKKLYVGDSVGNSIQIAGAGATNAAGGSTTQVQYNSSGALAGSSNMTFDGTTLTVNGLATTGTVTVGDASGDALTINSSAVSIPNGLNFDSNTFVIDATNDKIGIGTSTIGSGSKLEIRAANTITNARGILAINTTTAAAANIGGSISFGGENGQATTPFPFGTIAGRYDGTGWGGYLQFSTTESGSPITERMRITSTGDVLIGTTTSKTTAISGSGNGLTIGGATAPTLALYDTTNTAYYSAFGQVDTNTYLYNYAAGALIFGSNAAERMRIDSSGNVGIGTSSPNYKLSIYDASTPRIQLTNSTSGTATTDGYVIYTSGTAAYFLNREADATYFGNNNTVQATLDSSGNLGLGVTPSAWGSSFKAMQIASGGAVWGSTSVTEVNIGGNTRVDVNNAQYDYISTGAATQYQQVNGAHKWFNAASGTAGTAISFTQAMTLDASGNLGIGTTSPSTKLQVNDTITIGTADKAIQWLNSGTALADIRADSSSNLIFRNTSSYTERMRIDSSGNLLVGGSATGNNERFLVSGTVAGYLNRFYNGNATPYGCYINYTSATPNSTSSEFLRCDDATATRATIRSNGGLANYSANNVNLSDIRTKTDIELAGNYLDKICSIPVKTFKYKDQTDDQLNLGVIAQDVEAVAPELVDVSGFGETPEDGVPLKAIYQTDLQYALMRAIQELKAEVDSLKAQLNK